MMNSCALTIDSKPIFKKLIKKSGSMPLGTSNNLFSNAEPARTKTKMKFTNKILTDRVSYSLNFWRIPSDAIRLRSKNQNSKGFSQGSRPQKHGALLFTVLSTNKSNQIKRRGNFIAFAPYLFSKSEENPNSVLPFSLLFSRSKWGNSMAQKRMNGEEIKIGKLYTEMVW
jgi:hypothetical protein